MCIDFRRHHPAPVYTLVNGEAVEIVDSHKYLGIIIDDELTFDNNTNMLIEKSQQRLFCLRKLAKFQVDRSLMTMFYKSFIESVFTFSFICWFAYLNLTCKNSLTRITKVSSKIIGTQQQTLYNNQLSKKVKSIMSNSTHPLHSEFKFLPSGSRLRQPIANKPLQILRYTVCHLTAQLCTAQVAPSLPHPTLFKYVFLTFFYLVSYSCY